ncbi:MAG: SdpI family protein [Candidatus Acidiferrum sp.]
MNSKYYWIGILLTVAALIATILAYPHLPSSVVTHWNSQNQPNGYSPKWTLFLFGPGMLAAGMLLMYSLPWLSPKNFELNNFRTTYLQIMLILICLLGYSYALMLWAALEHSANVGNAIVGGVCLLFALLGNLMGKVRRNFFIGIRTPWALANERVWNATHRLAAKVFVAGGILGLALTFLGFNGMPVLAVLLIAAFIPAVYSLIFYKQLERRGELQG